MKISNIKPDNNRKYKVKSASGMTGWRQRLKAVYGSFFNFFSYCKIYNNHISLGYKTPAEAWKDNPVIEGSVNLSDYRNASTGFWFAKTQS